MNTSTLQTKTFWIGLLATIAGVVLFVTGEPSLGSTLVSQGLIAIGLRDALSSNSK